MNFMKGNYWKSHLVEEGRPVFFSKMETVFCYKHNSWAKYDGNGVKIYFPLAIVAKARLSLDFYLKPRSFPS